MLNTYLYVFTISCLHLSVFRYVDIVLGLSFLATHLVLMYSSKHESRSHLTLYFVLSVSTLLLYWSWFVYLKYGVGENEASKEVTLPQISQGSWFISWMEYWRRLDWGYILWRRDILTRPSLIMTLSTMEDIHVFTNLKWRMGGGGDTRIHDADEMNPNNANCSSQPTHHHSSLAWLVFVQSLPEASLLAFVCTGFF